MKWSYAAVGMIVLGIIGTFIIVLFQQITTNNESDYYLLKEVSEAAMIDAIDLSYYRDTGHVKIVKEKFVENFLRRFANSTAYTGTGYTIEFFDIYEEPPKSSIIITTGVTNYTVDADLRTSDDDIKVFNYLSGILEYVPANKDSKYVSNTMTKTYYFMNKSNSFNNTLIMSIPDELNDPKIKKVKIVSVSDVSNIATQSNASDAQGEVSRAFFDTKLYFESENSFQLDSTAYTLSREQCKTGSVSVTKGQESPNNEQSTRKLKFNLSNGNKGCVAVKFVVQWSYSEYK